MPENPLSEEALSRDASTIYAQLVLAGCISGWELADAAIRADASPANKIAALRYAFLSRLDDERLPANLRGKILAFAGVPE